MAGTRRCSRSRSRRHGEIRVRCRETLKINVISKSKRRREIRTSISQSIAVGSLESENGERDKSLEFKGVAFKAEALADTNVKADVEASFGLVARVVRAGISG